MPSVNGGLSVKAGSNWKKLRKTLAPESHTHKKRRRSSESTMSIVPAALDKGKGRASELADEEAETNGRHSRGSSGSPAPTTLPWFAEDLSPEDLALVRTNSEPQRNGLGAKGKGPRTSDIATSEVMLDGEEAEHRKRAILGGQAHLSKEKAEPGTYIAIDCEMVGVGPKGSESVLARVSLVNWHGAVLLDSFVRPQERVTDYRTWVSGVRPQDLKDAPLFSTVQQQVADLIKNRVLVGHAIHNDLSALLLSHPRPMIRDTATFQPCRDLAKSKYPSLRKLVALKLGIDIQKRGDEHSSVEDARATMALYRTLHADWQRNLVSHGKSAGPAAASRSGKLKGASSNGSAILGPGWKGKRSNSSDSRNGSRDVRADGTGSRPAAQHKTPRRSAQPDDPEWWSKV